MKKTLAALALAGAFAGSAMAANVDIYGLVDYGFMYNHTSTDNFDGTDVSDDSFKLQSGVDSVSRIGFKGTEDLGNGLKVGFKLENGFKADDGSFKTSGRLFDREASLHLYSDFGTFSFGRMGGVASSAGTYDIVFATADAFDGGDNDILGFAKSSRYDNMVAYQSPEFSGLQMTAMYSFKNDNDTKYTVNAVEVSPEEGSSDADRYAAIAATAKLGAANLVAAYEMQMYSSFIKDVDGKSADHGHTFYVGGNFDAGFAKFFALGEYFQGVRSLEATKATDQINAGALANPAKAYDGLKGFGLHVGAQAPIAAGTLTAGVYYVDATAENIDGKANDRDVDGDYLGLAVRYEYPLSQRTFVYTGAGYGKTSLDKSQGAKFANDFEHEVTQVYAGMVHKF